MYEAMFRRRRTQQAATPDRTAAHPCPHGAPPIGGTGQCVQRHKMLID